MKTAFEMALEAGFFQGDGDGQGVWLANDQELKAFAELVRADEREKYKWGVHSCGPTCTKAACVAMREAVKDEREAACDIVDYELDSNGHAEAIKIAIRARGQQ